MATRLSLVSHIVILPFSSKEAKFGGPPLESRLAPGLTRSRIWWMCCCTTSEAGPEQTGFRLCWLKCLLSGSGYPEKKHNLVPW